MGGSSYRDMRRGQILRARVILSTMVPHIAARILLKGKRIRGVLTPDPAVAAAIEGLTRIPVRLAPGGAEVDGLRAFRDGAVPVIAFAGSAQMVRGIDTLIQAMPRVQRIFPGAKLRLLLLPSLQLEEIVEMVRRSPVADSIELTTEPVADLRPELARCTVAAFPFKFDHATLAPPLTVAQAMSVGLPVIGTSVACISPILDSGYNGLQVPVHDPVALADAICRVLSSDGTWERLSKGAIATIARDWNWEKAAGAAAGLYEEVLDSRARREI